MQMIRKTLATVQTTPHTQPRTPKSESPYQISGLSIDR
jgi:hypothetical protein